MTLQNNTVKKGKLAIIDADGLLFYAGWAFRDQLNKIGQLGAKARLDKIIERILDKTGATHYIGFYGKPGSVNFRHEWATLKTYKGNRTEDPWQTYFKPILKEHFKEKWGFLEVAKLEADDAVVIAFNQFKEDWDIIMVGEDKDARQIGEHKQFNPNSEHFRFYKHTQENGRKFFWAQLLHGKHYCHYPSNSVKA